MQDLASGSATVDTIKSKINNGEYAIEGTNKYTPETLAGADDTAIDDLITNMDKMDEKQLNDITRTANEVLSRADGGTLNVKPEVRRKIETIAHSGGNGGGGGTTSMSSGGSGGGTTQGGAPSGYVEYDSFWE